MHTAIRRVGGTDLIPSRIRFFVGALLAGAGIVLLLPSSSAATSVSRSVSVVARVEPAPLTITHDDPHDLPTFDDEASSDEQSISYQRRAMADGSGDLLILTITAR